MTRPEEIEQLEHLCSTLPHQITALQSQVDFHKSLLEQARARLKQLQDEAKEEG